MKPLRCHFCAASLAAFVLATLLLPCDRALGDYLIFKTGERAEGRIVAEDVHSVSLEFQLGSSFDKPKVFPKSDVAQIIRETPAQAEFHAKQFERLLPSRDLMAVADYDTCIESLGRLVARFPGTPEAKRVSDMIATMTQERARVQAGEFKVEREWWDAATVKRERYEIDAYRHRLAMKEQLPDSSMSPDFPRQIGALREFEALRTKFPASLHYLKAIPEALVILDSYGSRLEVMAKEQPILAIDRQKGLVQLRGTPDEARILGAISDEERNLAERLKAQTSAGMKWRDIHKYDLSSIEAAQRAVSAERAELNALDMTALKFENENLSGARKCLLDDRPAEAEVFLARLRPRKSTLLNQSIFEELEKMLLVEK